MVFACRDLLFLPQFLVFSTDWCWRHWVGRSWAWEVSRGPIAPPNFNCSKSRSASAPAGPSDLFAVALDP